MADEGFILLWRRFFGHRYWTERRRYSRAEAWIDLIGMAAFRDREVLIGQQRLQLERGELIASLRYLEHRWRWAMKSVRLFMDGAVASSELVLKSTTSKGSIYRIVKYEDYQSLGHTSGARAGHTRGTKKKEGKEVKKDSTNVESGWSKPAGTTWKKHMGGSIPPVRLNVALSPLVAEHGAEEVLKWWDKYLASSTAAQFKTPENFAQRYGAWKREHSLNGSSDSVVSVDDYCRCVSIAGTALARVESRGDAFRYIEEKDPELWTRAGPRFQQMNHFQLYQQKDNPYRLQKLIESELARTHA